MWRGSYPALPRRRNDIPCPQPAYDPATLRAIFSETHDTVPCGGRPVAKYLVSLRLYAFGDTVAQILDNRGYFSYPDLKYQIKRSPQPIAADRVQSSAFVAACVGPQSQIRRGIVV